jgi:hypothetical protein
MTDNRKAGIALIVGSLAGVITMAIHPAGAATVSPDHVGHLVRMSGVAHALALGSMLLLFLGTCGLTRILSSPDRIAFSALVIFAFSVGALMIAAAISGWTIPDIMKLMVRDAGANSTQWKIVRDSIFQINQAMSRIYSVGAALSVTLWSASSLRQHQLSRGIALFGCMTAPLIAMLIFAGHLRLDVHGMMVVMLSEVVWFTGMGVSLLRENSALSARS